MTDSFSFDLTEQPWIPCLRRDGSSVELGLRATLTRAHELQMVAAETPQTTVALMRLLLAILHRTFGPADEEAWAALWTAAAFDADVLDAYFDRWRRRFDLFDPERPFYQVDDPRKQFKSVVSLKYGFSFMHDQHFDHDDSTSGFAMTCAEAARSLVALQAFGLSGTAGATMQFTGAPCTFGALFMIQGQTLKETLLLNLPAYPEEAFFTYVSNSDAPTWEQEDPFGDEREYPLGLLDYLTWQNRLVLLEPPSIPTTDPKVQQYKVGPGPRLKAEGIEPYIAYFRSKKGGLIPVRFDEEKGLWRDSVALFSLEQQTDSQYQPPTTFSWLAGILKRDDEQPSIPAYRQLECLALGIQRDSRNVAKVLFARSEHLPILPIYLVDPHLVRLLARALSETEDVARDLLRAVRVAGMHLHLAQPEQFAWRRYSIHLQAPKSINKVAEEEIDGWVQHSGVERAYWAALDVPYQSFMVRLPAERDAAMIGWQRQLRDTAFAAFESVDQYTSGDGRSLKALVHGRAALAYSLQKSLPLLYELPTQEPTP